LTARQVDSSTRIGICNHGENNIQQPLSLTDPHHAIPAPFHHQHGILTYALSTIFDIIHYRSPIGIRLHSIQPHIPLSFCQQQKP